MLTEPSGNLLAWPPGRVSAGCSRTGSSELRVQRQMGFVAQRRGYNESIDKVVRMEILTIS